jgi:threonine dehydrogenase-like Zn-dependent dehydrogenase
MHALTLADFGRMTVTEVLLPAAGSKLVLLAIVATDIHGSDLDGYTGDNGRSDPGQKMGHESVGRVASIGDGVDIADFRVGAAAAFNSVLLTDDEIVPYLGREQHQQGKRVIGVALDDIVYFTHLIAAPAGNAAVLPVEMSIANGAIVEPLAVKFLTERWSGGRPCTELLIIGCVPFGQSAVLAAISEGMTEFVSREVDAGCSAVGVLLGAATIDPITSPVAEQLVASWDIPVDVCIDAVGVTRTLGDPMSAINPGGTACLVGMGSPRVDINAYRICTGEQNLVGIFTYSAWDFRDAAAWMVTPPNQAASVFAHEVDFADESCAFAELATGSSMPSKVLVYFDR